ncbi:hypothetical protein AG1IA_01518 [Rhizoctonia solani AG-1 IA]|uniref:Uncharacterized protein n=1 Tax=Thanatephorus cucumeris (strain AG1-IA) TaxID=983506 RepID=L8X721_THACA|nr:hypothetical protein AG1IA_01518 [Rhizoctonia solani AG-1 IA]
MSVASVPAMSSSEDPRSLPPFSNFIALSSRPPLHPHSNSFSDPRLSLAPVPSSPDRDQKSNARPSTSGPTRTSPPGLDRTNSTGKGSTARTDESGPANDDSDRPKRKRQSQSKLKYYFLTLRSPSGPVFQLHPTIGLRPEFLSHAQDTCGFRLHNHRTGSGAGNEPKARRRSTSTFSFVPVPPFQSPSVLFSMRGPRGVTLRCARENPEDQTSSCKHCQGMACLATNDEYCSYVATSALDIPCTYDYQPKKRGPPNLLVDSNLIRLPGVNTPICDFVLGSIALTQKKFSLC